MEPAPARAKGIGIGVYARIRPPKPVPELQSPTFISRNSGSVDVTSPGGRNNTLRRLISPSGTLKGVSAALPTSPPPLPTPSKHYFSSMVVEDLPGLHGFPTHVRFDDMKVEDGISVKMADTPSANEFDMDAIFPPGTRQADVWATVGIEHIQAVMDGYNSTIFAYGRTGSGKTHSIVGPASTRYGSGWTFAELDGEGLSSSEEVGGVPGGGSGTQQSELGLVPRAFHCLLSSIQDRRADRHFTLQFACAEIYNRSLFDLISKPLESGSGVGDSGPWEKVEVKDGRMILSVADKLTWHDIDCNGGREDEAMAAAQTLIQRANSARAHASTAGNVDSSRSHVLYMCKVCSVASDGQCRDATLSIVDLAGSESLDIRDRGALSREIETKAINSSLHTLTRVVHAYATAPAGTRPAHVPYRESLLTMMLKDAIGGNCKTSIIVTLSDDEDQLVHSYKSCQFAKLARGVRNAPRENKVFDPANVISSLRAQVAELQEALTSKDARLSEMGIDLRLMQLASLVEAWEASVGADANELNAALYSELDSWLTRITSSPEYPSVFMEASTLLLRLAYITHAMGEFVKSQRSGTILDTPVKPLAVSATTSPRPSSIREISTSPMVEEPPEDYCALLANDARRWIDRARAELGALTVGSPHHSALAATIEQAAARLLLVPLHSMARVPVTSFRVGESVFDFAGRATPPSAGTGTSAGASSSNPLRLPKCAVSTWSVEAREGVYSQCHLDVSSALNAALQECLPSCVEIDAGKTVHMVPRAQAMTRLLDVRGRTMTSTGASPHTSIPCVDQYFPIEKVATGSDALPYFVWTQMDPVTRRETCLATGRERGLQRAIAVFMHGWLLKRHRIRGGWVQRYCILTSGGMYQSTASPTHAQLTTLALSNVIPLGAKLKLPFSGHRIRAEMGSGDMGELGFIVSMTPKLSGSSGKVKGGEVQHLSFSAFSCEDAFNWVDMLNLATSSTHIVAPSASSAVSGRGSALTSTLAATPSNSQMDAWRDNYNALLDQLKEFTLSHVGAELDGRCLPHASQVAEVLGLSTHDVGGITSLLNDGVLQEVSPLHSEYEGRCAPLRDELYRINAMELVAHAAGRPGSTSGSHTTTGPDREAITECWRVECSSGRLAVALFVLNQRRTLRPGADSVIVGRGYLAVTSGQEAAAICAAGVLNTESHLAAIRPTVADAVTEYTKQLQHIRECVGGLPLSPAATSLVLFEVATVYGLPMPLLSTRGNGSSYKSITAAAASATATIRLTAGAASNWSGRSPSTPVGKAASTSISTSTSTSARGAGMGGGARYLTPIPALRLHPVGSWSGSAAVPTPTHNKPGVPLIACPLHCFIHTL